MDLAAVYAAALARLRSSRFDDLCEVDQVLVTIWGLEADVNNGGFDQYFFNSSGDYAFFAERALRLVGAHKMALIVGRAIGLLGQGGVPRDRDERQRTLETVRDRIAASLDDLDGQFFEYPDDISTLVKAYLARNARAG